jgi:hypothetical protein
VALLVLLAVVVGLLVVVDRVGVGIAEGRVAEQIAARGQLAGRPDVDIGGFPFLTQAVAGEYEDVRVQLTADELGQPAGTSADVSLHGVHVPLSDVLGGSVEQIPVDRVDGTATLAWPLLAAQLAGDTTLAAEGDGVRVTTTVEVLGFALDLTASGSLALDGSDVVIDVQDAAAGSVGVPDVVVREAEDLLDLRYPVPALPFGLQLTGLRPTADGVTIDVEARDTVLAG